MRTRRGTDPTEDLNDRERIFAIIIRSFLSTQILADPMAKNACCKEAWKDRVHFATYRKPVKGDLVVANTSNATHAWIIGFYVTKLDDLGGAVIREIGSQRLCNYGNESFIPIEGLSKTDLLEGDAYKFYIKVLKAFSSGGEYTYRYGGLEVDGDKATIWVREVFNGRLADRESKPFNIKLTWTKQMSIKAILRAMKKGGYGTREFEGTPLER